MRSDGGRKGLKYGGWWRSGCARRAGHPNLPEAESEYLRNSRLIRSPRYSSCVLPQGDKPNSFLRDMCGCHREATAMAMMFGRFEIQSELSKSDTALIYKATDTETNQTVALKTQNLEPLGERSSAFVDALIAEGETTRELTIQNIGALYGAGEIEGQFCAAMEYVQGNSIATMLTRKEGFSIWDLLDITRQVCTGLDAAAAKGVVHHSLEPAKIMVQWDGLVKILGYGISSMSLISAETGNGLGRQLPYASPEQVRGDGIDLRSNLFTWGAVLYEMVTDRRAFDSLDPVALATQIADEIPPSPL